MGLKAVLRRWLGGAAGSESSQELAGAPNGAEAVAEADREAFEREAGRYVTQAELALLRLEWTEVLDKLTAWTNRQSARDRITAKKNLERMSSADPELEGFELVQEPPPPPAPNGAGSVRTEADPPAYVPQGVRHKKADLYNRVHRR